MNEKYISEILIHSYACHIKEYPSAGTLEWKMLLGLPAVTLRPTSSTRLLLWRYNKTIIFLMTYYYDNNICHPSTVDHLFCALPHTLTWYCYLADEFVATNVVKVHDHHLQSRFPKLFHRQLVLEFLVKNRVQVAFENHALALLHLFVTNVQPHFHVRIWNRPYDIESVGS